MTKFIAQNIEIADCELIGAGLPITQEGAEQFARQQWSAQAKSHRSKQSRNYRRHKTLWYST